MFQNIRSTLIALSSTVLAITTISCKDMEDIKGRYHGILKTGLVEQQVVTEIPEFRENGEYQVLEFSIYETKATSKAQHILVQATDDYLILRSSFLGSDEYRLNFQDDSCGIGENTTATFKLCIQPGAINFSLTNKGTGTSDLNLNLLRNDDLPIPPGIAASGVYTLDDLVGRAKFNSYNVSQEAEKVFQARQKVKMAIGNLLPHFNMKDLLSFVSGGPLGGIEAVGNLVPFIFPSNWYKWGEAEELDNAQRKSFASLRGNEMQFVENFFYLVQRDLLILNLMESELIKQKEIHRIIAKKELYGLLPPKSADKYYTNVLYLEQDLTQLKTLIDFELSSLAHAVALPSSDGISKTESVPLPDMTKIVPLDYKVLIEPAKTKSHEASTLGYLIEASKKNTKAHAWGFLDPNSNDTIGFGYASILNVGESQERELTSRRDQTLSMIEQRVFTGVSEFNSTLTAFAISQTGVATSQARLERLAKRLRTGDEKIDDESFVQELAEANQSLLKFAANRITAIHTYLISRSKVNRLILEGYYSDLELFSEDKK